MFSNFDPYDQLMQITKFCNQADKHLVSLGENQKEMVKTINNLKEEIAMMKKQIDLLEQILEGED
jgi:hypothetical protein